MYTHAHKKRNVLLSPKNKVQTLIDSCRTNSVNVHSWTSAIKLHVFNHRLKNGVAGNCPTKVLIDRKRRLVGDEI